MDIAQHSTKFLEYSQRWIALPIRKKWIIKIRETRFVNTSSLSFYLTFMNRNVPALHMIKISQNIQIARYQFFPLLLNISSPSPNLVLHSEKNRDLEIIIFTFLLNICMRFAVKSTQVELWRSRTMFPLLLSHPDLRKWRGKHTPPKLMEHLLNKAFKSGQKRDFGMFILTKFIHNPWSFLPQLLDIPVQIYSGFRNIFSFSRGILIEE